MKKVLTQKNQFAWELTTEEILWLRENNHKYTDKQLAELFKCSYARIRHFKDKYHIKKQVQQNWTMTQIKFLKDNYGKMGDKELSERLNRSMKGIGKRRRTMNLKRTPEQLFEIRKRNTEQNGGVLKAEKYCADGEKWFDRNTRVWFIRINGVAVNWRRWRYEQLHGKIPKGMMVIFADGNKKNTEDDNLILVKRNRGINLFKKYVKSVIYNQNKRGWDYYYTRGATTISTIHGDVWYIKGNVAHEKMKARIEDFQTNYNPPHAHSDNSDIIHSGRSLPAANKESTVVQFSSQSS